MSAAASWRSESGPGLACDERRQEAGAANPRARLPAMRPADAGDRRPDDGDLRQLRLQRTLLLR